jgi:hypothetical protein
MKENLQTWFMANKPNADLLWKDGLTEQVIFVRDPLAGLFAAGREYKDWRENTAFVISTHRSKSVVLPVYLLKRPGLQLILRYNFHNWKMSVISEKPIQCFENTALFYTTPPIDPEYTGDHLADVYFEGFPKDLIFGYYSPSDKKQFSAELDGNHQVWTVVYQMVLELGFVKPPRWSTRKDK